MGLINYIFRGPIYVIERKINVLYTEIADLERWQKLLYTKINEFDEKVSGYRTSIADKKFEMDEGELSAEQKEKCVKDINDLRKQIRIVERNMDIDYDKMCATVKSIPTQIASRENAIHKYQAEIRQINA